MFNKNCETTLVSQLFNSIDQNLKIIYLPMEQYEMSIENSNHDDDNELWLSGHRSIFSSYGSHCRKNIPSIRNSQYEGFHWDLYENYNYHHLAFEHDQKETTSLDEWSMNLNSDPPRTSWNEIKRQSISQSCSLSSTNTSNSDHYSPNPLTLYSLFQRRKSQQHPCRLYENFSDKSTCDSSSSSSSYSNSNQIPMPRIKLNSKTSVDQCLQTSTINPIVIRSKSVDRLLNNPSQSSTTRHSLPDLDFLTYYAKENPTQLSTLTKNICTVMKSPLFKPLSQGKKSIRTIFYCTIKIPPNRPTILYPYLQKPRTLKEIKRIKNIKTSPTTVSAEDNETFSSVCSSTSSSGYFSNSSRHIQTPLSPYPLKSCLKRTKIDELPKDILTSTHHLQETSKHRRYSAPTTSLSQQKSCKTCTLSEHDLRSKKSVSFCNEIARRLITPSISPKDRYDYCDLVPRESLTDSPPSEFNLSDDNDDTEENEEKLINFIENVPDDITKPLPIKYENDKNLIDAFADSILRILEIKCSDPKAYYLNNLINHELDRTLRQELCSLLREILEDGLRQNSSSIFSKKINLWRLIDLTTPTIGRFNEAKIKAQVGLSSTVDYIEKFNSFIYQLLK